MIEKSMWFGEHIMFPHMKQKQPHECGRICNMQGSPPRMTRMLESIHEILNGPMTATTPM